MKTNCRIQNRCFHFVFGTLFSLCDKYFNGLLSSYCENARHKHVYASLPRVQRTVIIIQVFVLLGNV